MRAELWFRAGATCEYCRSPDAFSPQSFAAEHIIPRSGGGLTKLENLAWSCQGCNAHKYNKTEGWDAAAGRKVATFHPRLQLWREHFVWGFDATIILGTTPSGRATVEELKLNRPTVVNLRRVLVSVGLHPPDEMV